MFSLDWPECRAIIPADDATDPANSAIVVRKNGTQKSWEQTGQTRKMSFTLGLAFKQDSFCSLHLGKAIHISFPTRHSNRLLLLHGNSSLVELSRPCHGSNFTYKSLFTFESVALLHLFI